MKLANPSRRDLTVAVVVGAVALILPLIFGLVHHYPWDGIPGFYAMYGALGCAAIVVGSKWLGKILLQRPESWYGSADLPEEDE